MYRVLKLFWPFEGNCKADLALVKMSLTPLLRCKVDSGFSCLLKETYTAMNFSLRMLLLCPIDFWSLCFYFNFFLDLIFTRLLKFEQTRQHSFFFSKLTFFIHLKCVCEIEFCSSQKLNVEVHNFVPGHNVFLYWLLLSIES